MNSNTASRRWVPLAYPLLVVALLVLATFLRFYHLDSSSLWSDEGNTWAMLSRNLPEIANSAAADIHPPGYYWLLKLWSVLFGTSAYAMRSFSAVAGVALVLVTERIGRQVVGHDRRRWWVPALAAFLAAANPFQIYYSQEARMYMLLALESAGLFWALYAMGAAEEATSTKSANWKQWLPPTVFVVCGIGGLWTHYSFPIVLAAAWMAFFMRWLAGRRTGHTTPGLVQYVLLNLIILIAFVPWLPVAVPAVLHWPKGGVAIGLAEGLLLTLRTWLFGPLRNTTDPLWPWLLAAGVLPLLGLTALWRRWSAVVLGVWLLLPVALMAILGLFSPAFLKFLLVTSPAWCLLLTTVALLGRRWAPLLALAVCGFGLVVAALVLPGYYASDTARDNYKGVAQYLAAVGDPVLDLVILDAPGQQEVWRYYDPGLPVLVLPKTRPAEATSIEAELATATADRRHVYTLLWATDEADPDQVVEHWLDQNAFKAFDGWQGNMRFAAYTLANDLVPNDVLPAAFGDAMVIDTQAQPAFPQRVLAGDTALVQLHWVPGQDIDRRYKVSVQLLDARDQVIAQHDSEPVGGSRPTDTWRAGDRIVDNYALPIPFGTPPSTYRLIVAVYDPATGMRLLRLAQDNMELSKVIVERPPQPPPLSVVPVQQHTTARLGPVLLAGYDAYRKDFAHAPQTPLQPGETLHLTLYWQAPDPLPPDWPIDQAFTLRLGGQELTAPLAGGAYATDQWQPGELVRSEFDIAYDGTNPRPTVQIDDQYLTLDSVP